MLFHERGLRGACSTDLSAEFVSISVVTITVQLVKQVKRLQLFHEYSNSIPEGDRNSPDRIHCANKALVLKKSCLSEDCRGASE